MRAPAFARRLVERVGTALDPAENHLDTDVEDAALVRMTAMVNRMKVTLAQVLGEAPSVVVWGDPAPTSAEAWAAEEAAIRGVIADAGGRCVCGRPAVRQVLVGWKERRVSEVAPEALFAWVCEDPDSDGHAGVVPVTRFPRSDRPVDEL